MAKAIYGMLTERYKEAAMLGDTGMESVGNMLEVAVARMRRADGTIDPSAFSEEDLTAIKDAGARFGLWMASQARPEDINIIMAYPDEFSFSAELPTPTEKLNELKPTVFAPDMEVAPMPRSAFDLIKDAFTLPAIRDMSANMQEMPGLDTAARRFADE